MNIPVANGKELTPTVEKICAEKFNGLLEKVTKEERQKGKQEE
jgi:hypothetical protein